MEKFISYAQNFEDVMLWRALSNIENGVFVDVGANDPVVDSVTKAFSCRGWTGINIEPVGYWYRKLVEDRPRDVNLQVVASSTNGFVEFFEITESGLSTTSAEIAQRHLRNGHEVMNRTVQSIPLSEIIKDSPVAVIHFLKIDVEGGEEEVLHGVDFKNVRPWIIIVEATEPNSTALSYQKWEYLLLDNDYEHVYFDGLNRFYVSREHPELHQAFNSPPGVLDNFIQYHDWLAQQELQHQLDNCQMNLAKITSSISWRITKLLRAPATMLNKMGNCIQWRK